MIKTLKALWMDEDGLTTVEYALLLALVAIVAITAWTTLGAHVKNTVNTAGTALGNVPGA